MILVNTTVYKYKIGVSAHEVADDFKYMGSQITEGYNELNVVLDFDLFELLEKDPCWLWGQSQGVGNIKSISYESIEDKPLP